MGKAAVWTLGGSGEEYPLICKQELAGHIANTGSGRSVSFPIQKKSGVYVAAIYAETALMCVAAGILENGYFKSSLHSQPDHFVMIKGGRTYGSVDMDWYSSPNFSIDLYWIGPNEG